MSAVPASLPVIADVTDRDAATAFVRAVIDAALARGATAAEASVSVARGFEVTVRLGEVETVEHTRDRGLGVTAYFGARKGSASSNDFAPAAIAATVSAACDIARHTSEDPCAGLAEPRYLAAAVPDLDLYHPWSIDVAGAADLARDCEAAARAVGPAIENSDGASVSTRAGLVAYGNSHGFAGAWNATRHALSCRVIARGAGGMQRDHWYSVARMAGALESAAAVGARAGARALSRLGARKAQTATVPVVFDAPIATSLIGHLTGAISGGAQYRQSSFLLGRLGQPVCAAHLDIREEPHLPRALGSAPFDDDGVATRARPIVEGGVLSTYLLSAYSARKLGLAPTGHAGGAHNLVVSHAGIDRAALLREMGRGLLVTELLGFGVNATTGDYSRGAAGYWVEDGEIAWPVEEITIAGNLKDMLNGIVRVAGDLELRGNIRTGSILIDRMTVAGK